MGSFVKSFISELEGFQAGVQSPVSAMHRAQRDTDSYRVLAQEYLQSPHDGRATWRQTFGQRTDKETRDPPHKTSIFAGAGPSQVRLIQSLQSHAPGGWSDDRWEQSRHFESIQYLAIHRKAVQLSQSEFAVFRKDDNHEDGKRPVKKGEPGYELNHLLEKPAPQRHWGELMYRYGQQMDLTGMHHTFMVPNVLGDKILQLFSIPTAVAIPQPAVNPDYPQGYWRIQPVFPYGPYSTYPTPSTSVGAPIPAQWMMTSKYPHPILFYDGYSPQTAMRLWIDVITQMDRSRFYSQRKAFRPSAVLNFEGMEDAQALPEPEINRVRTDFENVHQGPENHGTLIVAPPGGKFEEFGTSPKDMDWPTGWSQMADAILPGFGMTKPSVGMTEASSYAEYFASLKQVHLMTIKPLLDWYAADLTSYVAPYFGEDLIVEIRCQRIDDHELTKERAQLLADKSAITYNQLLKMMDQPTTDEPWGEERVGMDQQSIQMEQMGQMGGMPGQPQQPGQPAANGGPPQPPELGKRPNPGKLNQGSLGPRKHLERKSLYQNLREVIGNGRH